MNNKIIYQNKKAVGYIENNKYYTERNDKHVFRKYDSFNISEDVVTDIKENGARIMVFDVTLNGETKRYEISVWDIGDCKKYNYKGDIQLVIPIKNLDKLNKKSKMKRLEGFNNNSGGDKNDE